MTSADEKASHLICWRSTAPERKNRMMIETSEAIPHTSIQGNIRLKAVTNQLLLIPNQLGGATCPSRRAFPPYGKVKKIASPEEPLRLNHPATLTRWRFFYGKGKIVLSTPRSTEGRRIGILRAI